MKLTSQEYTLLYVLIEGDNGEPVEVLAQRVEARPEDAQQVLDGLVEKGILYTDVFYPWRAGSQGEIDYMFAPSGQDIYQHLLDENPELEK